MTTQEMNREQWARSRRVYQDGDTTVIEPMDADEAGPMIAVPSFVSSVIASMVRGDMAVAYAAGGMVGMALASALRRYPEWTQGALVQVANEMTPDPEIDDLVDACVRRLPVSAITERTQGGKTA